MPKIFEIDGFAFFFYSNEGHEPVHVHVRKGDAAYPSAVAKYWIAPIREEFSDGFTKSESRRIVKIIRQREGDIVAAWRKHFGF